MKLLKIERLHNDKKKYIAFFDNGKHTKFGASGYPDFLSTNSEEHKQAYIKRHVKDLETKDPTRAGYLSMYILWNKPTLQASIADYKRRFNL
jgi:type III secretory pathway component EscR